MLTFTHTYLLNLAFEKNCQQDATMDKAELILGNVIPDFITHLGKDKYQKIAHDLAYLQRIPDKSPLEWGAIFHILCDNYSTLGRITFVGRYHDFQRNGFIEKLSKDIKITIPLRVPKRRVLQCALDILILRDKKDLLIRLLKSAEKYLRSNDRKILCRIAAIYDIDVSQLEVGICRFRTIYGKKFIHQAASEEYRLFPLVRSLLNLDTLSEPDLILQKIHEHPELMELVTENLERIQESWKDELYALVWKVLHYDGITDVFHCQN